MRTIRPSRGSYIAAATVTSAVIASVLLSTINGSDGRSKFTGGGGTITGLGTPISDSWTAYTHIQAYSTGQTAITYYAEPQAHLVSGQWIPFSPVLQTAGDAVSSVGAARPMTFARLGSDDAITMDLSPGVKLTQHLVGASDVVPQAAGHQVMYSNAWPDVDATYEPSSLGVDEVFVVHAATAPRSFAFTLTAPSSLGALQPIAGGYRFANALDDGSTVRIPPVTTATTASGKKLQLHSALTSTSPGVYTYTVTLPATISADAFPVVVDPSLSVLPSAGASTPARVLEAYHNLSGCPDLVDSFNCQSWDVTGSDEVTVGRLGQIIGARGYVYWPVAAPASGLRVDDAELYLPAWGFTPDSIRPGAEVLVRAMKSGCEFPWWSPDWSWTHCMLSQELMSYEGTLAARSAHPDQNPLDVTGVVENWITRPADNNGFALELAAEATSYDWDEFALSTLQGATNKPSPTATQPNPYASISLRVTYAPDQFAGGTNEDHVSPDFTSSASPGPDFSGSRQFGPIDSAKAAGLDAATANAQDSVPSTQTSSGLKPAQADIGDAATLDKVRANTVQALSLDMKAGDLGVAASYDDAHLLAQLDSLSNAWAPSALVQEKQDYFEALKEALDQPAYERYSDARFVVEAWQGVQLTLGTLGLSNAANVLVTGHFEFLVNGSWVADGSMQLSLTMVRSDQNHPFLILTRDTSME